MATARIFAVTVRLVAPNCVILRPIGPCSRGAMWRGPKMDCLQAVAQGALVYAYGVILTGSGTPLSLTESVPTKPWWKLW
jgi:hypothetical protein